MQHSTSETDSALTIQVASSSNPIQLFDAWFNDAVTAGQVMPESMALATSGNNNQPSVRFVLLKSWSVNGFCFFTNYESRKAHELANNPKAAFAIHWPQIGRQVRVVGHTEKLPADDSTTYAQSRPRDSQIGAWASKQSQKLENRHTLIQRFERYMQQFATGPIPRPENWGGYLLIPQEIEFWIDQPDRLHDRFVFTRTVNGWERIRLYP